MLEAYTCNRGTDSIQLSMAEVSLPGDSVATHLAFVTWCLVKVVVEPWIETDCVGYAFSV